MTTAGTAQSTDVWTKIEEAQTHLIDGLNPDEWQQAYAEALCLTADGKYDVPDQESDSLSTEITVAVDGVEYDIHDYVNAHPEDWRFDRFEALDPARCERFGNWDIDASVPFPVLVRPYFTDYAVWELRHVG
ncbi:MAG: hypothetical protein M1415_09510 [Firmicutes bacterium]|jgi:hypothetical protein|nr:hypothetical protein [Bacillota bacterium]